MYSGAPGEVAAAAVVGLREERLAVAFRQRAGIDQFDRFVGEVEQPDGVREVAATATKPPRERRRGDVELVEQQRGRASLFDHVEVLAGDVLDQRELNRLARAEWLGDERRNRRDADDLGGPPATLARRPARRRRPAGVG